MDNPWEISYLHISIRLLLALLLGGLIGAEREINNRAAGLRTHILVCMGSALIMLLSIYGFSAFINEPNVRIDPSRLAAQVISGIGFLGAGTILFNGKSITGLTTAASLWVVAGIGLAVGAGFYYASVFASAMVLVSLWILHKVERKYLERSRIYTLTIHAQNQPGSLGRVSSLVEGKKIEIRKISMQEEEMEQPNSLWMTFLIKVPKASLIPQLLEEVSAIPTVIGVTVE